MNLIRLIINRVLEDLAVAMAAGACLVMLAAQGGRFSDTLDIATHFTAVFLLVAILAALMAALTKPGLLRRTTLGLSAGAVVLAALLLAPEALRETPALSLDASARLCEAWHGCDGGRLAYAFTPRFAPSCSRELMRGAADRAERYGAYLQTHLSENLQELDWVRELFPEAESYTDVYRRMGLLGPRTLLAHGIHLGRQERDLLRETGAHLAHCPRSNAFLASGIMPLRRWMEEGLSVGLGTDVGAGPSLSMWAEAAFACMASKLRWAERRNLAAHLRKRSEAPGCGDVVALIDPEAEAPLIPAEAFRLATLGGAKALGLEDRIGSLEVGKEADLVGVDPQVVDPLPERAPESAERLLSRLLYRERPGMVKRTWVRGKVCWKAP